MDEEKPGLRGLLARLDAAYEDKSGMVSWLEGQLSRSYHLKLVAGRQEFQDRWRITHRDGSFLYGIYILHTHTLGSLETVRQIYPQVLQRQKNGEEVYLIVVSDSDEVRRRARAWGVNPVWASYQWHEELMNFFCDQGLDIDIEEKKDKEK